MLPTGCLPSSCRLVIRRFLNYAITTPIIVYLVSCVSDFSGWRVSHATSLPACCVPDWTALCPNAGALAFTCPPPVFS